MMIQSTRPGTRITTPARDRRRPAILVIAVGVVLLAYPHLVTTSLAQNVGVLALTMAIAAAGWNILGGFTGQISFGHAVFFATGMYGTALFVRAGLSPWLAMLPCAAGAAVLAVAIGLRCFRLLGHYYAIATIAVGQIALTIVTGVDPLGAAQGLSLPLHDTGVWNLQFSLRDKTAYYYTALALFAAVTVASLLFARSKAGRYACAIRDNPDAAAAIGVPVLRYKLIAAAISAAVTSIAGTFHVMVVLFVDPPSSLDLSLSTTIAVIAILGGAGSLWGPLLGAWVFTALQEYTRTYLSSTGRSTDLILAGVLITAVALAEPAGLAGLADRAWHRARRAVRRRVRSSTSIAPNPDGAE